MPDRLSRLFAAAGLTGRCRGLAASRSVGYREDVEALMNTRRLDRNNFELRPPVRRRLEEAREALSQLEQEQRDYLNPPVVEQDPRSFNVKPVEREFMKTYDLGPLQQAFSQLEAAVRIHLDEEEHSVYPALRTFVRAGGSVGPLLESQRSAHVDLLDLGTSVRREIGFVPPMRKAMSAFLHELEEQIRYEETRIFPELLGEEVEEETPIPNRYRTATDVASALRKARPQYEPEPEPEPTGLLSGLFRKWVRNR